MPRRRTARLKALSPRPRAKPGSRSPEETRDALIDSGMALFAKHGLDAPSLDDICANAGVTRGAFYVHFKDRDDFLLAVMDRVGVPLLDELLGAGGGFGGAVARFIDASASGRYPLMPKGGIRPYQLLDACARSPVLRKRYVALVDASKTRIADLVRDGQDAGVLRRDITPESTASFAMALIVGLQTLADLGVPAELEKLAPELLSMLRKS